MKRPNKKDYDFNDFFECRDFAEDMIRYANHQEQENNELLGRCANLQQDADLLAEEIKLLKK